MLPTINAMPDVRATNRDSEQGFFVEHEAADSGIKPSRQYLSGTLDGLSRFGRHLPSALDGLASTVNLGCATANKFSVAVPALLPLLGSDIPWVASAAMSEGARWAENPQSRPQTVKQRIAAISASATDDLAAAAAIASATSNFVNVLAQSGLEIDQRGGPAQLLAKISGFIWGFSGIMKGVNALFSGNNLPSRAFQAVGSAADIYAGYSHFAAQRAMESENELAVLYNTVNTAAAWSVSSAATLLSNYCATQRRE